MNADISFLLKLLLLRPFVDCTEDTIDIMVLGMDMLTQTLLSNKMLLIMCKAYV